MILDSQNLRGTPVRVFERLVARGFSIHLSAISLEELWAQAFREDRKGLLLKRIPSIAPYIDRAEPIKTAGVDLVRRLGGQVRGDLHPSDGADAIGLVQMWRHFAAGDMPDVLIAEGGRLIENAAKERATHWLATVDAAAKVPGWSDPLVSEREIARRVAHQFFETFGPQLSVPGGMHERFEGFYRCAALHAARARSRTIGRLPKVDENDAEDLQLMMHIAEGVFLATNDLTFIEHVDASGTFQAPWVRTTGELAAADLPSGLPWGKSARRAAAAHAPRSRHELAGLEERIRSGVS